MEVNEILVQPYRKKMKGIKILVLKDQTRQIYDGDNRICPFVIAGD